MCSSLIAIVNSIVMSYFEVNKTEPAERSNTVKPGDDKNVVNYNRDITDSNPPLSSTILVSELNQNERGQSTNVVRIRYLHKLRHYLRPLRLFDWITLLISFIITVHAHTKLFHLEQTATCIIDDITRRQPTGPPMPPPG